MDNEQSTLTERVARLEAVVLDRDATIFPAIVDQITHQQNQQERKRKIRDKLDREETSEETLPTTGLEEIFGRIQGCTDRVFRTAGKLEQIGCRVMGPVPERDDRTDTLRVDPDGTLDHALLALNWLDGSLARLDAAALRLERI